MEREREGERKRRDMYKHSVRWREREKEIERRDISRLRDGETDRQKH